ncbi:hypothetical protein EVAR_10554_1 [Eumeta japonica]|uniref:Reverse transcriptase domain-containing protein n=1 Tax=Eumeta variegata TaxID=151549 RepID=A0A4C1ZLK7_EUMVA|nr:hypothetical protein EVAR_10554_1 [Eumeta japonica]
MEEDPLILEFMTQSLVERSREVGLEINISKTKMMTNSVPVDITINGQKLEYVEEYVYLGQTSKVPERHGEEHARFETIGQRKKYRHQKKTKVTDILSRIDQLKWRDGFRSRGRKAKRWEDDLIMTLGPLWTRVAADRQQWKELEEAFAFRNRTIIKNNQHLRGSTWSRAFQFENTERALGVPDLPAASAFNAAPVPAKGDPLPFAVACIFVNGGSVCGVGLN